MRKPRQYSSTGFYHTVIRGVNKQNIFFTSSDYSYFKLLLKKYSRKYKINIHAYCLMENHVHLEIEDLQNNLSIFMQCLSSSYARYFNRKYDRIGHLFQERFGSEIIKKQDDYLAVLRYILQNPLKAHICIPSEYKWCSYNDYKKKLYSKITRNKKLLLETFGDISKFYDWINTYSEDEFLDLSLRPSEKEQNYVQKIMKILKTDNPIIKPDLPKEIIKEKVLKLRNANISIRTIARITGITKALIQQL